MRLDIRRAAPFRARGPGRRRPGEVPDAIKKAIYKWRSPARSHATRKVFDWKMIAAFAGVYYGALDGFISSPIKGVQRPF